MLPIKKIYIDSRYKSGDSASDSNFYIDLPINLMMPDNTGFYIDDVAIPVSWYTIEEGRNNELYVRVNGVLRQYLISTGNYSLVSLNTEIVNRLNFVQAPTTQFTASPNVATNAIGITAAANVVFEILTDAQLKALNINANQSINNVLRNFTPAVHDSSNPYVSGFVDLFPIRNLYLTCSGLGNFNTMSVSGDRSIVKKIPVNAGYSEMIFDQSVVGIDYLDCSHQTLSRIGFQLKDVFGRVVDLHGNHVSFSIVFSRIQEIQ